MKNLHVFSLLVQDKNPCLLNWINKYQNISVDFVRGFDELNFYHQWNKVAKLSHSILLIEQFINTDDDIQVLELFVSSWLNNAETKGSSDSVYYLPRPNIYLPTEKFGMAIIYNPLPIAQTNILKKTIKKYLLQALEQLPSDLSKTVKRPLKKFLQAFSHFANVKSVNKEDDISTQEKHPDPQIPNSLYFLSPTLWKEWKPPVTIWNRQVIDKVSEIFPHPLGIHVILLNQCNLKCVMCPYHSLSYRPFQTSDYFDELKSLNAELFEKVANYAGKNKISLQFGQIEEPLLHRNIFDFFKQAKSLGVPHIHVTTNGTLLNHQKAITLANSGVDSVMFSVDAAQPETYLKIRGKDLLVLEENIKFFISLARKNNIRVMVSFILQPQAKEEKETFLRKWKHMGVNCVVFYVLTEHDPNTGRSLRSEEMYDKGERYPCASPWIQSVIFPDGDVSLCCKTMTDVGWRGVVSVGNLNTQSFEEIWLGEKYNQVRRELLENSFAQFDVCSDCHIWSASSYIIETTNEYTKSYNETMETINFL